MKFFFQQQLDPEAVKRAAFPSRDRERFITHWINKVIGDPTVITRTIVVNSEVAGNVVCWEQDEKYWIGYWYGREFWGRGIGSQGLALFLQEVKIQPLYADPVETNVGSVRLLEKCGFQHVTDAVGPATVAAGPTLVEFNPDQDSHALLVLQSRL